ncbi:MAG: hypothetical protein KKA65_03540 [Nanoarchaeota archaeon]|nr:hypothetical protein [Nanoarchaeota archaeon]MBU4352093.1 hypothetical protein [Nanoarchaeota archaeon]MBU4456551.1 hypothetical protein [Nanoarchaeota archaeon]MCG2719915.1 hypothetical protein [Nanoarchaeota archaeon]
MDRKEMIDYYSRKDVQEAILSCSKDREVGVMLGSIFGKRPDVLEYPGDVGRLGRQGATSFHISEERWNDALSLKPGMTKKQLDENRKGWDLIIDIDTAYWYGAKMTAFFIIEALKYHDINNYSIKFSGNKGLHIGVPFETFPDEVHGIKTKDLFPDSLRIIASYIQDFIKDYLAAKLLEKDSIDEIAKICNKTVEELKKDGMFEPFTVIEIDTVLISNRHLFRAPYSLHEKSGLVSLPINPEELLNFQKEMAKPSNIKTDMKFLDVSKVIDDEARSLVIQAFDWYSRKNRSFAESVVKKELKDIELPKIALLEETFPPCIKKVLEGKMEDGKKRALFVLIKFLRHMGWSWDAIENRIREWNESNLEPLRENYMMGQINYAKRNQSSAMAPNCDNTCYYKDLGICHKLPLCDKIKNPVNFAKIRAKSSMKVVKKTKGTS